MVAADDAEADGALVVPADPPPWAQATQAIKPKRALSPDRR